MLLYFLQGLTLGFSAGVQPGPFLAYLLNQTLALGPRRALPFTLAPLGSDGPIIAIILLVLTQMPAGFLRVLQVVGGLFLLYLAYGAYQTAQANTAIAPRATQTGFINAVLMNTISPGPWIFWSTVGGLRLIEAWRLSTGQALSFVLGFYITLIGTLMGFVLVFATAHRLDPRLTRGLNYVAALVLLGFGLYQLWRGILGG